MQARVTEDKRYADANGKNPDGKAMSKRPDLVARKNMQVAGDCINTSKVAGHVPGIAIGDRSGRHVCCMEVSLGCVMQSEQ